MNPSDLDLDYEDVQPFDLWEALNDVEDYDEVANIVLENRELRDAIMKAISKSVASEWKACLKISKLTADNRVRDYLLGINPRDLCLEFKTLCPTAYNLVTEVQFYLACKLIKYLIANIF